MKKKNRKLKPKKDKQKKANITAVNEEIKEVKIENGETKQTEKEETVHMNKAIAKKDIIKSLINNNVIINLTPHLIKIKATKENGLEEDIIIPESGHVARVVSRYSRNDKGLGKFIPTKYELPADIDFGMEISPFENYVVSYQTAQKLKTLDFKYKSNFFYPATCLGDKDDNGNVMSVPNLISVIEP